MLCSGTGVDSTSVPSLPKIYSDPFNRQDDSRKVVSKPCLTYPHYH
jgi:hypothetical protein